jgi:hypothetical protein
LNAAAASQKPLKLVKEKAELKKAFKQSVFSEIEWALVEQLARGTPKTSE